MKGEASANEMGEPGDSQRWDKATLKREPWPPVAGRPGLAQGRYGAQGNLELVAPAVDEGLWVGWFNSDRYDDRSTVRSRSWSGALRFGRGRRYVSADVAQLEVGPDWLEVIALTDAGDLMRHVWSPQTGFVEQPRLRSGVRDHSALVVGPDGCHHLAVLDADGTVVVMSGNPVAAPGWEPAERRVGVSDSAVSAAWHVDHLDVVTSSQGRVLVRCELVDRDGGPDLLWSRAIVGDDLRRVLAADQKGHQSLVGPGSVEHVSISASVDAAAAAVVTLDDRASVHLVLRSGQGLIHASPGNAAVGSGTSPWVEGELLAEVWVPRDHRGSVHRGVT